METLIMEEVAMEEVMEEETTGEEEEVSRTMDKEAEVLHFLLKHTTAALG